MKYYAAILLFFSLSLFSYSQQNLIPNGGFEQYNQLPSFVDSWNDCSIWNNAGGDGTPDYFHENGVAFSQLPNCFAGYVFPHSGEAIMGFMTWSNSPGSDTHKEYLSIELTYPLVIGIPYSLTFWTTNGAYYQASDYSSNNLGLHLSTSPIVQTNDDPIGINPMFNNQNQLWSTEWQQVTYNFVADSTYTFLTIGNFYPNSQTAVAPQLTNSNIYSTAYYFVDDFVLSHELEPMTINADTVICINDSITLMATGGLSYSWTNNDDPGTIISTDSVLVVSPNSTTTYTVFGGTETLEVTVNVISVDQEIEETYSLCEDSSMFLVPDYHPEFNYLWQDGSTDSVYFVASPGYYSVQIDHFCGSLTETANVIEVECTSILEMPNVFTPNGDDINDFFIPVSANAIEEPQLTILNRWGNVVFRTTDLSEGWNGKSENDLVTEGVYFWQINYIDFEGNQQQKQGKVHLLK